MIGKRVYIGCAADIVAGECGVGDRYISCHINCAAAAFGRGVVLERGTINEVGAVIVQRKGTTPVTGAVAFKKCPAGNGHGVCCCIVKEDRTAVAAPICCGSAVACFVAGKGVGAADIDRAFLTVDGTTVAFYGIVSGVRIGSGEIQCSGKKPDRTAAGVFRIPVRTIRMVAGEGTVADIDRAGADIERTAAHKGIRRGDGCCCAVVREGAVADIDCAGRAAADIDRTAIVCCTVVLEGTAADIERAVVDTDRTAIVQGTGVCKVDILQRDFYLAIDRHGTAKPIGGTVFNRYTGHFYR